MKSVVKLIKDKKVRLTYCIDGNENLHLFPFDNGQYCIFQKDTIDLMYKTPQAAVNKFYKLIKDWEAKNRAINSTREHFDNESVAK